MSEQDESRDISQDQDGTKPVSMAIFKAYMALVGNTFESQRKSIKKLKKRVECLEGRVEGLRKTNQALRATLGRITE